MRTNTLVILTPEGIRFTQHLAGPVTRFLAFAIDLGGITLISGIFSQFLSLAAVIRADFVVAARMVCYFVVSIGYSMLLDWTWRGQTLGKRVLKIRVVDAEGFRLRPTQIVIRNLCESLMSFRPSTRLAASVACSPQNISDWVILQQTPLSSTPLQKKIPISSCCSAGATTRCEITRISPPVCGNQLSG